MHKEVIISCILTRQTTRKIFTNLYSEVSKINVDTNSERRGGGGGGGVMKVTKYSQPTITGLPLTQDIKIPRLFPDLFLFSFTNQT